MLRYLFTLILVLPLAWQLTSCGDDEQPLPPYVQGLADLPTNSDGRASTLITDNGEELTLSNPVSGLRRDTTYRLVAAWVRSGTTAELSSYSPILALPVARYAQSDIHTDPLTVMACWKGAHYINLRLALKATATGIHYMAFNQTNYVRNDDGSRTLCAQLIHYQNNDPLYYTRETYLSLSLKPLESLLQTGRDSLRLTVRTFDGDYVKTFAL